MPPFNIEKVPAQKGRIAIVTGANIGLGYQTAMALAQKGMKVIMACRNPTKGEAARTEIMKQVPNADLGIMALDLSKLDTVRAFAEAYLSQYDRLDLLINNAGVMMPPYTTTQEGFEVQIGVNHLGHFLLTGLLLDCVLKTENSRVVNVSSGAHKQGQINFDDLHSKENYSKSGAYSQSKLANLLFTYEMQRRLEKMGGSTIAVAAHPGVSRTNLAQHFPKILLFLFFPLLMLMTQSASKGALPQLNAALGEDVKGGDYYGPQGFKEFKGKPGKVDSTPASKDEAVAKRLWTVSEELTGIKYL